MPGMQRAVFVLQQVQRLDQHVAPAGHLAQQGGHLGQRLFLDLPPLGQGDIAAGGMNGGVFFH